LGFSFVAKEGEEWVFGKMRNRSRNATLPAGAFFSVVFFFFREMTDKRNQEEET
jgi:hypothetical protein